MGYKVLRLKQRGHALPQATTESAREARKSFFCTLIAATATKCDLLTTRQGELCQKGYARMNDFEAHERSYDHSHTKVCNHGAYFDYEALINPIANERNEATDKRPERCR